MDFWWIDEPSVLGGANPTIWQLKGLYRVGFRSVVFLIDRMEQAPGYNVEAVKNMGFRHFPIFIRDFSAPCLEDFELVLTTVDWALGQGKVLIHCEDGLGGTGIIGAAYWVYKGSTIREAVQTILQSNPEALDVLQQQEKGLSKLEELAESSQHLRENACSWLK